MSATDAVLRLAAHDQRVHVIAPQPAERDGDALRLVRFPRAAQACIAGQVAAQANVRSSPGCGLSFATNSPWIEVELDRLRHHQPFPVGMDLVVEHAGNPAVHTSRDLRGEQGLVRVRLASGLERSGPAVGVRVLLPLISTAIINAISVAPGSVVAPWQPPAPRWLAIGDSLTQGFCAQSPSASWVPRVAQALGMECWNLGVGGARIEAGLFTWALREQPWQLITIGLGANHVWKETELHELPQRAAALAEQVLAACPQARVLWLLPPWKPCEVGQGPGEFQGLALDAALGERSRLVRERITAALSPFAGRIMLTPPLLGEHARLYPDGLHPVAEGHGLIAQAMLGALAAQGAPVAGTSVL